MGKAVKSVVKVAAFVAIAYFAPPVAASIGLSGVVGATVGAAVVGAAMGAATNAALGGNIGTGALMGGLSGGLAGFAKAPPGAVSGGGSTGTLAGGAAADTLGAAPTATGTASALGGAEDIVVNAPRVSTGLSGAVSKTLAGLAPAEGLSGATGVGAAPTGPPPSPTAITVGLKAPVFDTPVASAMVPTTPAAAPTAAVATPTSAGNPWSLSAVGGRLGDVAKAVGPQLVSGMVSAGSQGAALRAQRQALEDQQRNYQRNYDLKTQYAQDLITDANYYDPETFGRNAAESARARAGVQGANAAREAAARGGALTGQQDAIRRQAALAGGRQAQSDYWSAYGTAANSRTSARSAGIDRIPLGSPTSGSEYSSLGANAGALQGGTAGLISKGIGAWDATRTGQKDDPNTPQDERVYVG